MKLLGWIIFSITICFIAVSLQLEVGAFLILAVFLGVLIRIYTLLLEIRERLSQITKDPDRVREAYEQYMNDRNSGIKSD
ncbi:hypothetical protein FIU87_12970 [Bacillus sp. THAF10]|nr:hypothetical protein FIU87_12970 [Bacillus sp. THAF10]